MTKEEIIKALRDMARYPTVTLPRDSEALKVAADLLAQPEQEPVAYLCENAVGHKYFRWKKPSSTYKPVALYTTPPQRTWVDLTDEEIQTEWVLTPQNDKAEGIWFGRRIEAKLKEKNT